MRYAAREHMPSPRQAHVMAEVDRTGQIPMGIPGVEFSWTSICLVGWVETWVDEVDRLPIWRLTPAGSDALGRYATAVQRFGGVPRDA